jgi:hypothetical protein
MTDINEQVHQMLRDGAREVTELVIEEYNKLK